MEMAHPEGESSNSLLDTLEQWNQYLKANAPPFRDPEPGP
jgi:hypothetical protein